MRALAIEAHSSESVSGLSRGKLLQKRYSRHGLVVTAL